MTSREDLKTAFERLGRVREALFELVLDEPISILDKNEREVFFEVYSVEDLYDFESGTTLYYAGEIFTKTVRGEWSTVSKGVVSNDRMFKFLLSGGQFKCIYAPGSDK